MKFEEKDYLYDHGRETVIDARGQFADGTLWRRAAGSQTVVLNNVRASTMSSDPRDRVNAWRWELELASPKKLVLIRPLFTFTAISGRSS